MSNKLVEYIANFKVEDIVGESKTKKAIVIDSESTIEEAVQLLNDKKILSCPVYNKKTKQVIGMLDPLDIVAHLVSVMPEKEDLNQPKALEQAYRAVNLAKVSEVCNKSGRDPYEPFFHTAPASMVVPLFANGVHRIAMTSEDGDLQMTLSQSTFIKFFLNFFEDQEIGKQSVQQLGLGQSKPFHLHENDPVMKGLLAISKHGYSAIPVTTKDHKLVGTFSASDVKTFIKDEIPTFTQDIKFWLEDKAPHCLKPVKVAPTTTLIEVMKILSTGPHRVWVCDEHDIPTGVISHTDLFKIIRDHN